MRSPVRSSDVDLHYLIVDSPVGKLRLVASADSLVEVSWEEKNADRESLQLRAEPGQHPVLDETARQLAEYFAGTRRTFELALHFNGTDFQRKVWNALLTIPYGQTTSYGRIAIQIGHSSAVRAVGAANGQNPIPIIAPCHRVVGSTGKLVGFGGGLPRKVHLLTLEGALTGEIPLIAR
jgi:methylated-DNA-[protein]-cysteine S-methyltransferase